RRPINNRQDGLSGRPARSGARPPGVNHATICAGMRPSSEFQRVGIGPGTRTWGWGRVRPVAATGLRLWPASAAIPATVSAAVVRVQRVPELHAEHLHPREPAAEPVPEPAPRRERWRELLLRRAAGNAWGGAVRRRGSVLLDGRRPPAVLPAA